jgi:hypothetical protein
MTKLILALLAGGALMLAAGIPAARADTSCTGLMTGRISGNVVVPNGGTCILGSSAPVAPVTVTGNVTVQTGAALFVEGGSTVEGNISADQCISVEISFIGSGVTNSVHGNVSIQNCTGENGYGGPEPPSSTRINGNFLCQGSRFCFASAGSVGGNVQVDDNPSAFVEDNSVGGNVQVDDNSVDAKFEDNSVGGNVQVNNNGSAEVETNTVNGNLKCQGNESLTASGNTVHGNTHCSP